MITVSRIPEQGWGWGLATWVPGQHECRRGKRKETAGHVTPSAKTWVPPTATNKVQIWMQVVLERCQLANDIPGIGIPAWAQLLKTG